MTTGWKPHAGNWKVTLKEEGKPDINVTGSYRPSATKLCYVSSSFVDGTPAGNGLFGYDPVRECWVDHMYFKVGESSRSVTSYLTADVDKKLGKGTTVDIVSTEVTDGTIEKVEYVREYTEFARGRMSCVHRNRVTSDGEKLPNVEITWERLRRDRSKQKAK